MNCPSKILLPGCSRNEWRTGDLKVAIKLSDLFRVFKIRKRACPFLKLSSSLQRCNWVILCGWGERAPSSLFCAHSVSAFQEEINSIAAIGFVSGKDAKKPQHRIGRKGAGMERNLRNSRVLQWENGWCIEWLKWKSQILKSTMVWLFVLHFQPAAGGPAKVQGRDRPWTLVSRSRTAQVDGRVVVECLCVANTAQWEFLV